MGRFRWSIVMLVVLVSCVSQEDGGNPSVSLLTHNLTPEDGLPAAEISADLITDAGCVVLRAESSTLLAVWPPGSTRTTDGVQTPTGEMSFGDRVTLGGGEVPADVPALEDTEIPERVYLRHDLAGLGGGRRAERLAVCGQRDSVRGLLPQRIDVLHQVVDVLFAELIGVGGRHDRLESGHHL